MKKPIYLAYDPSPRQGISWSLLVFQRFLLWKIHNGKPFPEIGIGLPLGLNPIPCPDIFKRVTTILRDPETF
jgi:hypothetical protein